MVKLHEIGLNSRSTIPLSRSEPKAKQFKKESQAAMEI